MTKRRTSDQILTEIKKASKTQTQRFLSVSAVFSKIVKDQSNIPLYWNLAEIVSTYVKRLFKENGIKVNILLDKLPALLEIEKVLFEKPIGKTVKSIQSQMLLKAVRNKSGDIYISITVMPD